MVLHLLQFGRWIGRKQRVCTLSSRRAWAWTNRYTTSMSTRTRTIPTLITKSAVLGKNWKRNSGSWIAYLKGGEQGKGWLGLRGRVSCLCHSVYFVDSHTQLVLKFLFVSLLYTPSILCWNCRYVTHVTFMNSSLYHKWYSIEFQLHNKPLLYV